MVEAVVGAADGGTLVFYRVFVKWNALRIVKNFLKRWAG